MRTKREYCVRLYLSDDGIVRGGHFVKDAVDAPQLLLILRGDAVVLLVVVFHSSTLHSGRAISS